MAKKAAKKHHKGGRPKRNATIGREAFIGMITNAIEVYKKECFGILIGTKHKKHFHITDTVAFQTAKRDYEWVNIKSNRINRINFALSHLTDQKVIGDFHSHPEGPDKLSGTDEIDLLRHITTLTCLVSIYKSKKCEKWIFCEDKSICGSIGGKFFVRIKAYEMNHTKNEIDKIKIVCPYVKKINKLKLYAEPLCK